MENNFTEIVISTALKNLSEYTFTPDGEVYQNEKVAFKIEYNETKKLFVLLIKGENDEFTEKSTWLFDENHNKTDAECIGEDFAESILKAMGADRKKAAKSNTELPEKAQNGKAVTVSALCSSMLSVYPQFKDAYKEHVEHYGEFLCINFFKATVCPALKAQLKENNKKQVKKVIETICDLYINGDRTVCNIIPEVIILGATGEDEGLFNTAISYMDECPYLSTALKTLFARLKSDKKLRQVVLDEKR